MTRARQTLALARLAMMRSRTGTRQPDLVRESAPPAYLVPRHSLQQAIADTPSVLQRAAGGLAREASEHVTALSRRFRRPELDEIDLGFAGRQRLRAPVHRAIAALGPRDSLKIRVDARRRWELLDRTGSVVGRLAEKFEPPAAMRCVSAVVHAVVTWSCDASDPKYHGGLKCDRWEVVVPELIFEPDA